jgi:hypothetical protein
MSDGGKGSTPRPFNISRKEFENNWDAIFKKDKSSEQKNVVEELVKDNEEIENNSLIKNNSL